VLSWIANGSIKIPPGKRNSKGGRKKNNPCDTRVIAATNRNLWSKVEKGLFREDLFYRITVLYIEIPPLRQRKEDIPLLVKHITNSYCPDFYEKYHDSWQELIDSFGDYSWPGNIRELENIINRCCIIFDNIKNLKEEYSILLNAGPPPPGNGKQTDVIDLNNKYNEEYSEIVDTLNQVEWNREKAARKLGMSRTTLWRKIKQYEHK
jgi:transcriptional regulator, propionate catabolism operon regulatory protein